MPTQQRAERIVVCTDEDSVDAGCPFACRAEERGHGVLRCVKNRQIQPAALHRADRGSPVDSELERFFRLHVLTIRRPRGWFARPREASVPDSPRTISAVPQYLLLPAPAANRVYAEAATSMVRAELTVLGRGALAASVGEIGTDTVAGVEYVSFDADPLAERDLAYLGLTSAFYALFEREGALLRPVAVPSPEKYPTDLLTILKYQGKTNEQFTRLVLNVTAASTARPAGLLDGTLRVLDPVCGRGTTLSQAVMYGLDAVGVDVDTKDFELYTSFFTTWLKDHRFKHTAATTPVRRDKTVIAKKYEASFAADKAAYLAGEKQSLTCYAADTRRTAELVRPGTVDVIVADLPYGVQHGSRGPRGLVRNPLELLDAALPGWAATLRRGGAAGLAWNVRVAPRADVAAALTNAGLTVQDGPGYDDLQHRVDRSITRDVIVARRD